MFYDYYAILGVHPEASLQEIKQAYRRLVRLHHPDLTRSSDDQVVKLINEAYKVLGDASRRTIYDIQRLEARRQALLLASMQGKPQSKSSITSWSQGLGAFLREMKNGMRGES